MSLALRLGFPHYDYLLPYLSARQLGDVIAFHATHNVLFDRDDTYWTQFLAMYFAAHKGEHHSVKEPLDFCPWYDQFAEDITADDLKRKLGFKST